MKELVPLLNIIKSSKNVWSNGISCTIFIPPNKDNTKKMETTIVKSPKKPKRSVSLEPGEKERLEAYCGGFKTMVAAGLSMGVDRYTLQRVLLVGSGAPQTIALIRKTLKKVK